MPNPPTPDDGIEPPNFNGLPSSAYEPAIFSMTDDELREQLSRLIMENQSEDGSIDISDQSAMRDEILSLIHQRETALLERVEEEVIGEDEHEYQEFGHTTSSEARNEFRYEQRIALATIKKDVGGIAK